MSVCEKVVRGVGKGLEAEGGEFVAGEGRLCPVQRFRGYLRCRPCVL